MPALREGETGKKRHGDHAIAVALAHFASRMRWVEYDYRGLARRGAEPSGPSMLADGDDDIRDWYRPPLGAGLRGGI